MSDPARLARRRVKARLDTEGYLDEQAAVDDAARIAAFVAAPDAHEAHADERRTRLDEVDPSSSLALPPRQKLATTRHEVLLLVAMLLGFGAVALTLPGVSTGRAALRMDPGLLWAGILALSCLGLYVFLEPYRRASRMFSLRTATTGMLLFLAVAWTVLVVLSLLSWREVPSSSIAAPGGMALLVLSIAGAVALWLRGRRTDRLLAAQAQRRTQLDAVTRRRFLEAMDQWWRRFGIAITDAQRDDAQAAFRAALGQLHSAGVISAAAEAEAGRDPVEARWREDRA